MAVYRIFTIICLIINLNTSDSGVEMGKTFSHFSIKKKIIMLTVILMVTVIVLISSIGYWLMKTYVHDMLIERAEGLAGIGAALIPKNDYLAVLKNTDSTSEEYKRLQLYMNKVRQKDSYASSACLMIFNKQKNQYKVIITSNGFQPDGIKPFSIFKAEKKEQSEIKNAQRTDQTSHSEIYTDSSGEWITGYAPIIDADGKKIGIYVSNLNVEKYHAHKRYWMFLFIASLVVVFILVYTVIRYYLNKLVEPINKLLIGFTKVSNGDFKYKLNEDGESDFKELFQQYNYMVEQLNVLFEKLSATSVQFSPNSDKELPIKSFDEAIKEMENIIYNSTIQKELQQAEKMNAIGQLAASVAHEIRNPMTVVKGFLQIFLSKDHFTPEEQAYIKLMVDEINRAEGIINDYLSLAKPDLGSKQRVCIVDFTANIVELMNSYALMQSNIHLNFEVDFDEEIYINENEVKQILINIMKNGIEAMKHGGEMTFRIYQKEPYIVFSITDTGVGMSKEEIERLGTAFYSLKEKGTGIGLMVCYQMIERMKGKIEVESMKGNGTTFTIYIPKE